MRKVYWGDSKKKKLIGKCQTDKEAFDLISDDLKKRGITSVYYRFWHEEGRLVIDYGSHHSFYYVKNREE